MFQINVEFRIEIFICRKLFLLEPEMDLFVYVNRFLLKYIASIR